jgi:UDP-N-acetylmuramoylalanine--D-glutamate ligase
MIDFKNKKITLMGLGLLGRGVGDAAFFAEAGADLTVTDLKSEKDLASSLESLKKYKNIKFVLGEHRLEDFRNVDLVVKAAGVPLESPFIAEAEKNGVPVKMSTQIFAENTKATIVGVTGTRGKSTVSYLLTEILKEHYKGSSHTVFLGGNILGVSTIDFLNKAKEGDVVVLELDSWQLQGFATMSPKVAVFTTFMRDHLNYYNNSMERYFADKANIYRSQKSEDVLIISEQVKEYIEKFGPKPKSKVFVAHAQDVPDSWEIGIPGEHNRLNVALAAAAAKAIGISEETIRTAVENFKAAPGRLEKIRNFNGIDIYNDTNGTTQDATIAGLKALGGDKKTILIFGGADKKLEFDQLLIMLPQYTKALVLLPGTGTDRMKNALQEISKNIPTVFVQSMNEAVQEALKFADTGDRVLLSPAFASFGLFKNEYDRGDQFNAAVKNL